ncbi:hypothetical protein QYF36_025692 [Acer negundo]|nr:hypothetical protein QYF36_025692 [Acer negundo]
MKLTSKRQIESIFRQATSYKDPEDQATKRDLQLARKLPAHLSTYRLRDSIHEVFDKENASEKDLDKTTDDALIAPPGTKNSSADCCYSVERQLSLL